MKSWNIGKKSFIPLLKSMALEIPFSVITAGLFEKISFKMGGIVSMGLINGEKIMNIIDKQTAINTALSLELKI